MSKTFSIRINKLSTIDDVDQKIEDLYSSIYDYLESQVPITRIQIQKIKKEFGKELLPKDHELEDFLTNDTATIRITEDYSNYHPDKCQNGGNYGFWEELAKTPTPGVFVIIHYTTATIAPYCPACGKFTSHEDCEDYEKLDLRV